VFYSDSFCHYSHSLKNTHPKVYCITAVRDSGLLRLVAEVPVHEDSLFWILTLGITRDLHLSTPDVIDLIDILVKRAALLHSAGTRQFPSLWLFTSVLLTSFVISTTDN